MNAIHVQYKMVRKVRCFVSNFAHACFYGTGIIFSLVKGQVHALPMQKQAVFGSTYSWRVCIDRWGMFGYLAEPLVNMNWPVALIFWNQNRRQLKKVCLTSTRWTVQPQWLAYCYQDIFLVFKGKQLIEWTWKKWTSIRTRQQIMSITNTSL